MIDEEWHCKIIEKIAEGMKPSVYVELGIFMGQTLNRVAQHVGEGYAVDVEDRCNNIVDKQKIRSFKETTNKFADRWRLEINKPIDLIFIDADHSRDAVFCDVKNFWPYLVADTGLMLLHDMWPPTKALTTSVRCGNAYESKNDIMDFIGIGKDAEIITLPVQYGLTIIRKKGSAWQN
jgi:predicted O-methyltransferase YrrM